MNPTDISPVILVFAMFFTSIALVIAGIIIWGLGQLKRERLACAATQLNDILHLANEALKSGSKEQQELVNSRIKEWDKQFSRELHVNIISLTPA